MTPRFIFRTHYQVCEPAYLEFLVKLCTSPVQSSYREVVAKKLATQIESRCKTEGPGVDGIKGFNEKAGEYAVDLARGLNLINQNHGWTERGHLVNLIADVTEKSPAEEVELNPAEKLLHFRIFLEGDGAAILFLGRFFLENRCIQNLHSPDAVNRLAQEMFVDVLRDYYAQTQGTTDRLKLRRYLESLRGKPFKGKGGTHKIKLHVQTLYRLGLLKSDGYLYELPNSCSPDKSAIGILLRRVPDISTLEKVVQNREWIEIAAEVLMLRHEPVQQRSHDKLLSIVATHYRKVMDSGTPLASLHTLIEAAQITMLIEHAQMISYAMLESVIIGAQKRNPKDLRFHVDRLGRPAFVKMSSQFADLFAKDGASA
jgi:hypothetical protein